MNIPFNSQYLSENEIKYIDILSAILEMEKISMTAKS